MATDKDTPHELDAAHLRAVLESTADGMLVVDEGGHVLTSNRRFAELWHIPDELLATGDDERLLGFVLQQLLRPEEFLEQVKELYSSYAQDLKVLEFKDGRVFERFSAPLIRDGLIAGRVWSFRDVTKRTKAEAALRESEERFRSLYHFTPVMLHSIDETGTILDVNDYWLERTGYRRDQVIGRKVHAFLTESSRETAGNALADLLEKGTVDDVHYEVVCANGEVFDGMLSAIAKRDDRGAFVRSFAAVVDVSERKRAEEARRLLELQVLESQKLESLGILAGGIAHDFNNLLVGILGNADVARQQLSSEDPARKLIDEVITASQRAAELCNQMLAYAGKGRFVIVAVNLTDVVRDTIRLLEVSLPTGVSVTQEFAPSLPAIEVDLTQIRQLVMNLITNAADAVEGGEGTIAVETGRVRLEAGFAGSALPSAPVRAGDYVFLSVTDNGRGMDRATRARIFDPFFTSKSTGRGLGLAAALGIVRGHGGTIDVQSEPGRGSEFKVYLPASKLEPEPIESPAPSDSELRGDGLVLVVDDEESVRFVAKRMLERAGFEVVAVAGGEEALEVFRERGTDIRAALVDMTMPGLDGRETLAALRELDPSVPIVISSGYDAQKANERLGDQRKPSGFIQKPYRSHALVRCMLLAIDSAPERGGAT